MTIDEIEKDLKTISKYPWKIVKDSKRIRISIFAKPMGRFSKTKIAGVGGDNIENNSRFIANAPTYIEFLLAEVKRLQK